MDITQRIDLESDRLVIEGASQEAREAKRCRARQRGVDESDEGVVVAAECPLRCTNSWKVTGRGAPRDPGAAVAVNRDGFAEVPRGAAEEGRVHQPGSTRLHRID